MLDSTRAAPGGRIGGSSWFYEASSRKLIHHSNNYSVFHRQHQPPCSTDRFFTLLLAWWDDLSSLLSGHVSAGLVRARRPMLVWENMPDAKQCRMRRDRSTMRRSKGCSTALFALLALLLQAVRKHRPALHDRHGFNIHLSHRRKYLARPPPQLICRRRHRRLRPSRAASRACPASQPASRLYRQYRQCPPSRPASRLYR